MAFDAADMLDDQAFADAPWDGYAKLRDETPALAVPLSQSSSGTGGSIVILSRFDDVRAALQSPAFAHPTAPDAVGYHEGVKALFSPRAVRPFTDRIAAVARDLLTGIAGARSVDFHEAFNVPFSCRALLGVIGFTDAEVDTLMERKDSLMRGAEIGGSDDPGEALERWRNEVSRHLDALLERKERDPGNDLATGLQRLNVDGRPMSRGELIAELGTYVRAGLHTVTAALDCTMARLATDAELQRVARTHHNQRPRLIEELLRIDSPVMVAMRRAACPAVRHDVNIAQGDLVMLLLGAADTDERRFAGPLTIDLARRQGHVAFSAGPHRCLGAHLARLELSVALEEIFAALGTFALPAGEGVHFTFATRWAKSLPLVWTDGSSAPA